MKYELGKCAGCGNIRYLINKTHYLCIHCNRKRLDGQKGVNTAVRHAKAIKKYSKSRLNEIRAYTEADAVFYAKILKSRERRCVYCGEILVGVLKNYWFHHLFHKAKYPALRYKEANVDMVCFGCHQIAHSANPTETMLKHIFRAGKFMIRKGWLEEIGEPNPRSPHLWVIETEEPEL